ncbi:MAG TPA: TrkA C-terminal domain-containing protein, partial [Syntrophorhabdaceae bacterium]|nr:TrkA C-terminal domain-containing protein [Syntrophorhabdaceae bacterium]
IRHAEDILQEIEQHEPALSPKRFAIAEIEVSPQSPAVGKSLSELKFRKTYSVTVIGIIRDEESIKLPKGKDVILKGDRLLVIGTPEAVDRIKDSVL